MPFDDARTLTQLDLRSPLSERMFRNSVVRHFDTPPGVVKVTAGAESTNTRRLTFQVMDRLREDWPGRWLIFVGLSATAGGDFSASGNTASWHTGEVLQEHTANAAWTLRTEADGSAALDLTISGAASRVVTMQALGLPRESDAIAWSA